MTRPTPLLPFVLPLLAAGLLAACENAEPPTRANTAPPETQIPSRPVPAPVVHFLHSKDPIVSLAAIPATTHRGNSHIAAAHGSAGVSIRDTTGKVLSRITGPARLVAHYQNLLLVYSQDDQGVTSLVRYELDLQGNATLVETASPSPIAATTLQRTSIAALGPLQVSGSNVTIGDQTISATAPITAIAAASYFPPLVSGQTLLIATDEGDIIIQSHSN